MGITYTFSFSFLPRIPVGRTKRTMIRTETPIQFAADADDAIYAIKAAMEEADITPETSVSDTCDKMKEAMLKIKVNGLTGEDMTWTEDGEPHKAPKAVKVVDGAYQAM